MIILSRPPLNEWEIGLTSDDVARFTPKFWRIYLGPIWTCSGPAFTIMAIQYNLVVGTLRIFSKGRNDLRGIIDDMMAYKAYKALGLFPFSEVGHGLDIANLRTTATLFPGGGFELHTTCLVAARCIHAADYLSWENPLLINDGKDMCKGISARVLPGRNGLFPFNHAITTFHRVQLPLSALLGELDNSVDVRLSLWHVGVGAISLSAIAITCLKVASTNVYRYSMSCHVGVPPPIPIVSFRTQQIPIFTAVAQRDVIYCFYDASIVLIQQSNMRGMSMAEGDVFVLCIHLARKLLLGRYSIPEALNSNSLLAKHMYTPSHSTH
ncbi:hypothetical protein EDD18DRAFT_1408580 [Armillaria luteobubalina]|uniref:Uncharacterized protein n=1 Tax=Armillaria luteobubalina TaxID=153913 RepID=A0AA39TKK3_9AGAR|nr:hypothetical protein EDD18DRAFT_1408580 [Armillaria luteobubalina]